MTLPSPLLSLRRFARMPDAASDHGACDACGVALAELHRHLLDVGRDRLACCCERCALRADPGRLRPLPTRVRALAGMQIPAPLWRALGIPVELAFLRRLAVGGPALAMHPGPAGATHSELSRESWDELCDLHPLLRGLEPGVEGLLASRLGGAQHYFTAPLDVGYRLVGLVRAHYRGLDGGPGLQAQLRTFFDELEAASEVDCA